jgi:O-antigen ligase
MNLKPKLKAYLAPKNLASLATGFLFFILVTQKYINERYSLLERASIGLIFLLVIVYFTNRKIDAFYISIPATLLTLAIAISIIQIPATYIIQDFLAYFLIAVFSIILISSYGVATARNGVLVGLILLLFSNFVVLTDTPNLEFFYPYKFVGTSYGSNTLAASLIITVPTVLTVKAERKALRVVGKFTLLVTTSYFIFITGALTAQITLFTVISLWLFYLVGHKWRKSIPWLFVGAGISITLIISNGLNLLAEFGKNSSFSGRVPLWNAYLEKILENPITGYGWAFQTTTDMPLGLYIFQVMGVPLTNAHNDFLNWWAQTGILGAICFLVTAASAMILGFKYRKVSEFGLWLFFTGIVFAINGFSEITSMYADGWFVLMIVSSSIALITHQNPTYNGIAKHLFLKLPPSKTVRNTND